MPFQNHYLILRSAGFGYCCAPVNYGTCDAALFDESDDLDAHLHGISCRGELGGVMQQKMIESLRNACRLSRMNPPCPHASVEDFPVAAADQSQPTR